MMDYKKLIERLEKENERVDTTEGQREANLHRIKWIMMLNEPKHPETPYVRLDVIREGLKDKNFRCTPSSMLLA